MDIRDFEIIRTHNGRDFVVRRNGFPHRYHSHFKRRSGAELVLNLLKEDTIANKPYFRKAQKRLTTEEEYEDLKEPQKKNKYYNSKYLRAQRAGVL